MSYWGNIKHFTSDEFDAPNMPGSGAEHFSIDLARFLDVYHEALSKHVGHTVSVIIHHNGGYAVGGHSGGSQHYKGRAVDSHAQDKKTGELISVIDQYLVAEKLDLFGGIGFYPQWNRPGLHLDIGPEHRRWSGVGGSYSPLNAEAIELAVVLQSKS